MKKIIWVPVLALAAGIGYWGWQRFHPADPPLTAEQPAARTSGDTLKYPPDAPQLTFLQIKPVAAFPEPLVEPLNARIVYDDNHTARVFSPLAGRVIRIEAETGQRVKAGGALLSIKLARLCIGFIRQRQG